MITPPKVLRVALAVLESMLTAEVARGRVEIWRTCKPTSAETKGDRIVAVRVLDMETGAQTWVRADYVLDATELGDVLALAGVDYVSGAESSAETGELHAPDLADPENVQALAWCFAVGYDPDGNHTIDRPDYYAQWRDYDPGLRPAWPGKMLSWTYTRTMQSILLMTRLLTKPRMARVRTRVWACARWWLVSRYGG